MTEAGPDRPEAPWWSSGADGLDDHVDPLDAHRRARATAADDWGAWEDWDARDPDPPDGAVRSTLEDALEGLAMLARAAGRGARRDGRRGDEPPRGHAAAACRGCPWCTLTRSLGDARPEVAEHLEQAMRHVVLAARAWVDAAERHTGDPDGWQHIPLDDEEQR